MGILTGFVRRRESPHRGGDARKKLTEPQPVWQEGIGSLLLLAGIAGAMYLGIVWYYALPLVADKRMHFWAAMELSRRVVRKHWWMNFFLLFLAGLMVGAGFFVCLVGALVAIPLYFVTVAQHYEKVFGDLASSQS